MTAEFHEPLVPAEVDLRDFSFMPLDVRRLRDSDLSLIATGEEFKAAVLLWCAAWHQIPAGSLPNDERWLARHSGAAQAWQQVRGEALRGFVLCSDNRLYHRIIAEKAMESWRKKLAQRERTRQATEARRKLHEERNVGRDDVRNDHRNDQRNGGRNVHQGKLREVKGREGKGSQKKEHTRARKTPPPADFGLSDRVKTWAAEKGYARLEDYLEFFLGKAKANGYTYADWDEALMSCIRDDWPKYRNGNGSTAPANPNRQESLEERNLRVAAAFEPPDDDAF